MTFDEEITLDSMAWRILAALQSDARLSAAELGRRVDLSAPAVAERVRKLEDTGVISGYHARVNLKLAGRQMLAFLRISAYGKVRAKMIAEVEKTPEVLGAHRGTGSDCFILKLGVRDIAHLDQVIERFVVFGQLTTSIVLSSPLEHRPITAL